MVHSGLRGRLDQAPSGPILFDAIDHEGVITVAWVPVLTLLRARDDWPGPAWRPKVSPKGSDILESKPRKKPAAPAADNSAGHSRNREEVGRTRGREEVGRTRGAVSPSHHVGGCSRSGPHAGGDAKAAEPVPDAHPAIEHRPIATPHPASAARSGRQRPDWNEISTVRTGGSFFGSPRARPTLLRLRRGLLREA